MYHEIKKVDERPLVLFPKFLVIDAFFFPIILLKVDKHVPKKLKKKIFCLFTRKCQTDLRKQYLHKKNLFLVGFYPISGHR